MSGFHAQPGDDTAGAAWRSLSGDPVPAPQQPIYGGWQQPWQDESGQWYYPYSYAQPEQAPPYDPAAQVVAQPQAMQYAMPAQPVEQPAAPEPAPAPEPAASSPIVPEAALAPVGPPRYYAPARAAQDPRQRTMAAVITFVCLLIALWAILGFLGSLSKTLSSVSSGTSKLEVQLTQANKGLASLDEKTSNLNQMSQDTRTLASLLGTIDGNMGGMLADVDKIATGMQSMNTSLGTLEGELTAVNSINDDMASQLGGINAGLGSQVKSVRTMRRDVQATGTVLSTLPGRLEATNGRLAHVNGIVNYMGCRGITNNLEVTIKAGPFTTGVAKVFATVVPPGAWGALADGRTPCPAR